MALKLPKLQLFSGADAKSRIFLLFAGVVGFTLLIYIIVKFFGGNDAAIGGATVAKAPSGLVSVPGSELTPQYARAVELASEERSKRGIQERSAAVPTLMNVSSSGGNQGNCTVLCPGDEKANVADDLARMVADGKLSTDDQAALLDLAAKNVSVDEYAAALDALVKAGKLTPEQARLLLEKYKKQHANAMLTESAKFMDGMIKSGELPLSVANELLELQKSNVTPEEYAEKLDCMVRDGKITKETAAKLLAQYVQQQLKDASAKGSTALKQMVVSGQVTADVAKVLLDLQASNVPLDQYNATLKRLVAEGKMTPATSAKLLDLYREQRTAVPSTCSTGIMGGLMTKGGKSAELANRLLNLQANNAPLADYAEELKRAVAAGLLTPEEAKILYQQYQAKLAVAVGGVLPAADVNVPAFAELQQRLNESNAKAGAQALDQFNVAPVPAGQRPPTPEELQAMARQADEKQKRIEQMMAAMSGQAQSLVLSWQAPVMVHREGTPLEKEKSTTATVSEKSGGKAGETIKGPVLIKAGTILFGVLDTAVDSDYPDTPVMVTIIEGKFKNAKLLGKLSLAPNGDKVSLNFNLMDTDDWTSAKAVSAFAIDPDTAKTVMASQVDNHYLERYGYMMATAFTQGYSKAITNEGTSTTGIFGTSTSTPALSPGNKLAVGLGQIGQSLSQDAAKKINRPPTVKVNSGVGLGILFTAELTA